VSAKSGEDQDESNHRFGRGAVVPAQAGLKKKRTWSTKFEMRSLRYTTPVSELPTAHA
jgi:DNA polymerase V